MKNRMTPIVFSKKLWRTLGFLTVMFFFTIGCGDNFLNDSQAVRTNQMPSSTDGSALATTASLPHTNLTNLSLPVRVDFQVDFADCSNNPGPFIYFSGITSTGGFGVRTIFRNNVQGTHTYTDEKMVDVGLQPLGTQIIIPKQPSRGGVGGNPYIYVQFEDANGNPMGDEIFIGRCVQGSSFKGSRQLATAATSWVNYQVSGCSNSPGPTITFDAGFSMSGLSARIIFRNNVKGTHQAIVESSSVAEVIHAGTAFSFPKQPVLGGVGGNPWIWTQFTDASAVALSGEILLGRCVQISQAL